MIARYYDWEQDKGQWGRRQVMDSGNRVQDKRTVKLENVLKKDFIPFKGGRPEREKVIGKEDVLNLAIALNTSETFEEFLQHV
jgi:hypothetical protein